MKHAFIRMRLFSAVLLLACALPAAAQERVTATSGSPAAIARIRTEVAATEREAPGYRQTTHELVGYSLEGGELTAFFRGSELRKLNARHYGETGQSAESYYYAAGRPVFIHVVEQRYEEGLESPVRATIEHRYYLDGGRLIRYIRTQRPAGEDLSSYDPELDTLLQSARHLAACAAADGAEPPECTAPEG